MAYVTKDELVAEFRDTKNYYEADPVLIEAVESTNARTKVYPVDFSEEVEAKKDGRVRVEIGRTFERAIALSKEFPGKRIAVLNFAASTHPGGGVKKGSYAQEESLCRCSTLYPSLLTDYAMKRFYYYHIENCDWRASDTCIYSPDVVIVRDDKYLLCDRLRPSDFVKLDVITCAAPHVFREIEVSDEDLYSMHVSRAKNILRVAAYNGVDIFVSGAFGCGAFHNDPKLVARAWHEAMKEYGGKFDLIDFVIYVSDFEAIRYRGETSLHAFRNEFAGE
ncbi:MAG: TIGR02452 family protein [Synergistaceae bacterium]|nr:TIGR02452 family protein [Synergistaceae bacterium]